MLSAVPRRRTSMPIGYAIPVFLFAFAVLLVVVPPRRTDRRHRAAFRPGVVLN
jgi:hypothetical protein